MRASLSHYLAIYRLKSPQSPPQLWMLDIGFLVLIELLPFESLWLTSVLTKFIYARKFN